MRPFVVFSAILVAAVAVICAAVGYVMNIFALLAADAAMTLVELAVRIAGIFVVPVGIFAGWVI